jgi:hypothetical protein
MKEQAAYPPFSSFQKQAMEKELTFETREDFTIQKNEVIC